MKSYSLLIHGSGTCGEGTPDSADIALQKLLEQLTGTGHNLTSASIIIDGNAVSIIGSLQPHPAADEAADPSAVTLRSISRQLDLLNGGVHACVTGQEAIYERVALLLPQGLAQAAVLEGTAVPAVAAPMQGGRKKKKGGEPLNNDGVIEEAQPIAVLGSGGRIAVPAGEEKPNEDPTGRDIVDNVC